jgi:hypothetical protein
MDGIKLSVKSFEKYIAHTDNYVWYGILKRRFKTQKHTLSEWLQVIESIKSEPAR